MSDKNDPQYISFKKLYNARDLGGLPGKNGQKTAFHRFLRTDAPIYLDENEKEILYNYPVTVQIDLRSDNEIQEHPSVLSKTPKIQYLHIPIVQFTNEDMQILRQLDEVENSMGEFYIYMLSSKKNVFCEIFRQIANVQEGCILFNCTHGKDRTGLVAALLLLLAGVSEENIIRNYEVSYDYLRPLVDPLIQKMPMHKKFIFRSDRENLQKALFYLNENHHGSAEDYLYSAGITENEIKILEQRMF